MPLDLPRKTLIALAIGALLLAGCGRDNASNSQALPDSSEQLMGVDPWAIPETIDIPYVQRVVNEIERLRLEVQVDVYNTQQFSDFAISKLQGIYEDPYLDLARRYYSEASMKEHPYVKADPDPSRVTVKSIRSIRPGCINAIVDADDSPGLKVPGKVAEFAVTLRKAESRVDSNITQWRESNWDAMSADNGKIDRCAEA